MQSSNRGNQISRRALLSGLAAATLCPAAAKPVGLSFGTYGLRMFSWEEALELVASAGYDGVEIALLRGWPTEPKLLSNSERIRLRRKLGDLGLELPAVAGNLWALHPAQSHQENLDLLRRGIDLGADLSPGKPPIFGTGLGRKTDEWDAVRYRMVDEVGDWARVAADGKTVVSFKPHAGNAVHNVERSLWLIKQVNSPYLRCTYDYSHLWLAGHDLVQSLQDLLPVSHYINVKDAKGTPPDHRYLLPGDGTTDYVELFRQLRKHGYGGFVTVEVSVHIHGEPDYEPVATLKLCYQRMAAAFEKAGLPRP